jgi:hypothetical protein
MKLDHNNIFRKGKTYEDRLPVGERPRIEAAKKRRARPSHLRGAKWDARAARENDE